jgi:deazaflavin-dependent oxidoreductase (nitroreductase family)
MAARGFRPPDVRFFRALYALGLGPIVGRLILLLTTTGRRSGLPRVTALQYEEVDGAYYLGSSRGLQADWVRNLMAQPRVGVRVRNRAFEGRAEVVTDPERLTAFIELRLRRHPHMVGRILQMDGLPAHPTRPELAAYAARLALVIVHPLGDASASGGGHNPDATMKA